VSWLAKAQIDDTELLRLYEVHGTIEALSQATYYDREHLRKRLRRLGVPPRAPGRPRTYWEAVTAPDKPLPMIHAIKGCRQLRKARQIQRSTSIKGRTHCSFCTPLLHSTQMADMRRIALDDLRVAVYEVMGEDQAAAVMAQLEGC
jgi:hypothetical protein